MKPVITFALAKGRLAEQAFELLEQLGIDCSEPRNPGRQLVLWDKKENVRFILVKPSDVPTYVDHGVADIGIGNSAEGPNPDWTFARNAGEYKARRLTILVK